MDIHKVSLKLNSPFDASLILISDDSLNAFYHFELSPSNGPNTKFQFSWFVRNDSVTRKGHSGYFY